MNILREIRRVRKRSMASRIRLILIFSVILIVNTYAWFNINEDVKLKGLEADVTPWDVTYYVDGKEILDQDVTFTIDELYPGMPNREDTVHIYNLTTTSSNINYELASVKVYGQEILEQLKNNGGIKAEGNTVNVFTDDTTYPFKVSYTYDKTRIDGEYVDDEKTPEAGAKLKLNVSWTYQGNGTDDENLARDILDTKFGKEAYKYYQNENNDPAKAIEIVVKITSSTLREST